MTDVVVDFKKMFFSHRKTVCAAAVIFVISVLLEIFVFNFRYFLLTANKAQKEIYTCDKLQLQSGVERAGGGIRILSGNATVSLSSLNIPVYNIKINYTSSGRGCFNVDAKFTDDNFSRQYTDTGSWYVDSGVAGTQYLNTVSSGKMHELLLDFSNAEEYGVMLTSIEVNSPYFNFRLLRFLAVFVVLCALYALHKRKPWRIPLNLNSTAQTNALVAVGGAAILIMTVIFTLSSSENIVYRNVPDGNDNYMLLTEALANGRLSFLEAPPSALSTLSDPYDISIRSADNIQYKWDAAYYNGKYYCYFGAAPVVTLMLPFRLLTGFYLSSAMACFIFEIALLVTLLMLYRLIVSRWYNGISFPVFVAGAVAVVLANSVIWLVSEPRFYELAVISANMFLFLALTMLVGMNGENKRLRLFLAGLFFALMVASRPNFIFYLLLAVPLLIPAVKKMDDTRVRAKAAVLFLAPLAVSAVLLMVYNKARFGSFVEFGAKYQLTLNDPRFNGIGDISRLFPGLYHYLIEPFSVNLLFPFFHCVITVPTNISQYYFNFPNVGILNFPLLLILPACIYIFRRMPKERGVIKRLTAFCIAVCMLIIIVDIMMAGVTFRYELDVLPALTFAAVVLWFEAYLYLKNRGADVPAAKLFVVTVTVTSLISLAVSMVGETNLMLLNNSRVFDYLRILFEFWR